MKLQPLLQPLNVMALMLLLAIGLAPPAEAGECIGCPSPAVSDVIAEAEIPLQRREAPPPWDALIEPARDYVEMDAGDCFFKLSGGDDAELIRSWLVLRAYGEVWNCPHSKSTSTISASVAAEDRTSWSVAESGEVGLNLGVIKAGHALNSTNGGSRGITETTDLSTTITAQACRRIPWLAYLRVGRYKVEIRVAMIQPYKWWTKNSNTGAKVHSSGTYEQECAAITAPFERTAPMAWHLRLAEYPCADCSGIAPKDLGWFPKLPEGEETPPLPPGVEWPDPLTSDPGGNEPWKPEPWKPEPWEDDWVSPHEEVEPPNGLPPGAVPWDFPPVG